MLRARVPQVLTLAVGMTACTGSVPAGPDGGNPEADGAVDPDGTVDPTTRGLTLRFVADPALPASYDDGELAIGIDSVELHLQDLRVIGDAAPGDERTRIDALSMRWPASDGDGDGDGDGSGDGGGDGWGDGSGDGDPGGDVEIEYADAPPGIYSLFRASVVRFEIDGDVEGGEGDSEVDYDFEIDRDAGQPVAIEIDLGSATLEPGGIIELTARFDARAVLASVPWADLGADGDGEVEIAVDHPAMDGIEAALAGAFERADAGE